MVLCQSFDDVTFQSADLTALTVREAQLAVELAQGEEGLVVFIDRVPARLLGVRDAEVLPKWPPLNRAIVLASGDKALVVRPGEFYRLIEVRS